MQAVTEKHHWSNTASESTATLLNTALCWPETGEGEAKKSNRNLFWFALSALLLLHEHTTSLQPFVRQHTNCVQPHSGIGTEGHYHVDLSFETMRTF